MSNLVVVSNNIGRTASLAASSEAGSLVVENLQADGKALTWRSVGTAATITATFDSAAVSCVSLPICNLSSTATMQVQCGAYDSGAVQVCQYAPIDAIDFTGPLNANAFAYGGGNYATLVFPEQTATGLTITLNDPGNPAGYIDAAYLVIGEAWSPEVNADYGASLSFGDTSRHSRADNGDLKTRRGGIFRKLSFTLSYMQTADRTALTELLFRNGMSVPLFLSIFPDSTDTQLQQMYQIYGKQSKLSSVTRYLPLLDKGAIEIEEM